MNIIKVTENSSMKKCTDCLNCKVSATSTKNRRLCFCSEDKQKTKHLEIYFIRKTVCKNFSDMSA